LATETPVAAVQPEVPTTLEGARQFLARDPGADESFGMAEKFRAAKSLDGEFLLLRNAATKGNAPAALALGQMYDPTTYSPETSPLPAPNPEQATVWYRQGAEAGIAEAQYRLGVLLMSGKTDEPNGPEMGVSWLRKAADQGHQPAKEALPK
jgi:TPR repeat protein